MSKKYGYYGVFIGKKSDFIHCLKTLIKNKINVFFENDKFYVNFDKTNLKSIKSSNLEIQKPNMTSIYINYLESDEGEIKSILKQNGFFYIYLGDDGSWLSIPYGIFGHKTSYNEIADLAKNGYFTPIKKSLWNIGENHDK